MSELHDMVAILADRVCEMREHGLRPGLGKPNDPDHRCPEEWPDEPEEWCLVCSARVFLEKPAEKLVPESVKTRMERVDPDATEPEDLKAALREAERKGKLLASAYGGLLLAAQRTLTEQRREFARGDIADLDKLEDVAVRGCLRMVSDDSVPEGTIIFVDPRDGKELGRAEGFKL